MSRWQNGHFTIRKNPCPGLLTYKCVYQPRFQWDKSVRGQTSKRSRSLPVCLSDRRPLKFTWAWLPRSLARFRRGCRRTGQTVLVTSPGFLESLHMSLENLISVPWDRNWVSEISRDWAGLHGICITPPLWFNWRQRFNGQREQKDGISWNPSRVQTDWGTDWPLIPIWQHPLYPSFVWEGGPLLWN